MKKKADKEYHVESFEQVPIYHKTRTCKKCNNKLELSRWNECVSCKPDLGDEDEFLYFGSNDKVSDTDLEEHFDI